MLYCQAYINCTNPKNDDYTPCKYMEAFKSIGIPDILVVVTSVLSLYILDQNSSNKYLIIAFVTFGNLYFSKLLDLNSDLNDCYEK